MDGLASRVSSAVRMINAEDVADAKSRAAMSGTSCSGCADSSGWTHVVPNHSPSISNVTFAEYANIGPGAAKPGERANFSTQLTSPVSIHTVLNSTSWIDPLFLYHDTFFG